MITEELIVKTPIAKVWNALTNPDKMKQWYFDVKNFKLMDTAEFYFYEPNGTNFKHVCKILEVIPQKRFRHTWSYPEYSKGVSVLTWRLTQKKELTHIKLVHSGIENFADAGSDFSRENFVVGWQEIVQKDLLDFLKND